MKNEFIGFYMPNEKELKAAWRSEKTKFIFDTNVLLKLYSYQPNTLSDFFSILKKLGDKIWIPHQVGLEFQNRRLDIKAKEKQKFSELEKQLDEILKVENKINQLFLKGRFPNLDAATENLFNDIRKLVDGYKNTLNQCNESQPNIRSHDSIREKIDDCFKGKVGSPFSQEDLEKIYEDGEKRYKNKIPPGFKDSTKNPSTDYFYKGVEYKRKFGDLILWKQIIEKAKDENIKNVIFITDDEKEDWWYIAKENGDKAIGPLANLTHEIIENAKIDLFHMYNTSAFFQAAKEFTSVEVQDVSIDEIRLIHENELRPKRTISYYEDLDEKNRINRMMKDTIFSSDDINRARALKKIDVDNLKKIVEIDELNRIIRNKILLSNDSERALEVDIDKFKRMLEIDRLSRIMGNWEKIARMIKRDEDDKDQDDNEDTDNK
nr:PIN-like domain-containing protein [uncultured Neisseria sp.]